jgi:hypothetical protein
MNSVPRIPPPTPFVIRVAIARRDPLAGTASAERGRAIRFDSWFELLDALSRLVSPEDDRTGNDPTTPVPPGGPTPSRDPLR